jgi:hypothetical protein
MNTRKLGSKVMHWLGLTAAGVLLAASAHAAGITATKHNLSTTGTGTNHVTTGTDQICVFCHTPHGSNTSAAVPLWNKNIPTTATYQLYSTLNTSSLNGEVLAVGSVSMACLSCHDGTQAMDNMMNAPGAGGFNASGARPAGWVWTGANQTAGSLTGAITNLGADLKNDHPIGIAYCGGGLTGAAGVVSGTCADGDFISPAIASTSDGRTATFKTATINTNQVFWIDLDASGTRGKADINLYTRTFAAGANRPSVECGSCHDPHVESKGSDNVMFMRVTTAASKICLSCHVK